MSTESDQVIRMFNEERITRDEANSILRAMGYSDLGHPAQDETAASDAEFIDERIGQEGIGADSQQVRDDSWNAVKSQLSDLDTTISAAITAAFNSQAWLDFERSLAKFGDDVSKSIGEAADSPYGRAFQSQAQNLATAVSAAVERSLSESKPQIQEALRRAEHELGRILGQGVPYVPEAEFRMSERERIMRLVREGRLTNEQARELLAELEEAPTHAQGPGPVPPASTHEALRSATVLGVSGLESAILDGANFNGAYLNGVSLSGAILDGANLREATLKGVDFTNANFSGSNLKGVALEGCDFTGAKITGANLSGAVMTRANLRGTILSGANLAGAVFAPGVDLSGRDLQGRNLSGVSLSPETLSSLF